MKLIMMDAKKNKSDIEHNAKMDHAESIQAQSKKELDNLDSWKKSRPVVGRGFKKI